MSAAADSPDEHAAPAGRIAEGRLSAVIRSAGERTVGRCRDLLASQMQGPIEAIAVAPFAEAVILGFEIGLDQSRDWTLIVDADVLLCQSATRQFLAFAETASPDDCRLNLTVYDWMWGGSLCAGVHLYRTRHLEAALKVARRRLPSDRPETVVTQTLLAESGLTGQLGSATIGLHDCGQWRADLYRTGYVHGQRHRRGTEPLVRGWRRRAATDPDTAAFLAGYEDGRHAPERYAVTDIRPFAERSRNRLAELGIEEKLPLREDEWTAGQVDAAVDAAAPTGEFRQYHRWANPTRADRLRHWVAGLMPEGLKRPLRSLRDR